jgi:hypothetical protein
LRPCSSFPCMQVKKVSRDFTLHFLNKNQLHAVSGFCFFLLLLIFLRIVHAIWKFTDSTIASALVNPIQHSHLP